MKVLLLGLVLSLLLFACGVDEGQDAHSSETADARQVTEDLEEEKEEKLLPDFSAKREAVYEAVDTFLEVVVNEDSKDQADYDIRKERREQLQPVVSEALLKEFEPTDEELLEQGYALPTDEFEYDETVSPVHNLMENEYILENRKIYIDEASIATDTVHVIADVDFTHITDFQGHQEQYDEVWIYKLTLEDQEDGYIITAYELLNTGQMLPEALQKEFYN